MHPAAPERRKAAEVLQRLASDLRADVIGQDEVVATIAGWVEQAELGLTHPAKPRGSFLFLGPTGVGKTELAKSLAANLSSGLARFDLSEFQTAESVDVFLGRGAGDGGRFAAEMTRAAGCRVLLLDEIEKAFPRLLDLLLQVLDEGRLTTASGQSFDLSPFYIVLTSNLGAGPAARMRHNSATAIERAVTAYARQTLRPELFARIDIVAVFRRLDFPAQEEVCRHHLQRKLDALRSRDLTLTFTPDILPFLLGEGFSDFDGARPLERAIHRFVNGALVEAWRSGSSGNGQLRLNRARTGLELQTE